MMCSIGLYSFLLPFLLIAGAHADQWDGLRAALSSSAEVVLPSDTEEFATLTTRYSKRSAPGIDVVVYAGNEGDVVNTINFAKKNNITYLTASSGHGWPNMNQTQDAIYIRIDKLNSVTMNYDKTVTVGGGIRSGALIDALYAAGRETATGVCDCTGALGVTLGGGHGRRQGVYGLMLDNLVSVKLVLWNGTTITASSSKNKDLFWAIRGAGHNFGVVTQATYKTYPLANNGQVFNTDMIVSGDQVEELWKRVADVDLPAEGNMYVFYLNDPSSGQPVAIFNFAYYGSEAKGKAIVDAHFSNLTTLSRTDSMIASNKMNSQGAGGFFNFACQGSSRKNGHTVGIKKFDPATQKKLWDEFTRVIRTYPDAVGTTVLFEQYGLDKYQAIDAASTAYPNRDVNIIVLWAGQYSDASLDTTITQEGRKFVQILQDSTGYEQRRVYVNYAHGDEDPRTYYGYDSSRLQKLNSLKKQYDPKCKFAGYMPLPYCK